MRRVSVVALFLLLLLPLELSPAPNLLPPFDFEPPAQDTLTVLQGVVRDLDGNPLPGVEVTAMALGRVTQTDDEGNFRLRRLPAGTFEFHFRRLGYLLDRRFVTLDPGGLKQVEVALTALVP